MDAVVRSRAIDHVIRAPVRSHVIRGGKGGPGAAGAHADAGVSLSWVGALQADEILPGMTPGAAFTATDAASTFLTRYQPTVLRTMPIYANLVQVGTVTTDPADCGPNAAGLYTGTVALTAGSVAIAGDALVDWAAPSDPDPALLGGCLKLSGD